MTPQRNDIGAYIQAVEAIAPKAYTAETVNGTIYDARRFGSLVLHVAKGAETGSPTAYTATVKIQESSTSDFSGTVTDVDNTTITLTDASASDEGTIAISLNPVAEYIRVTITVAFTGGASPTLPVACTLVLGGPDLLPASDIDATP